MAQIKIIHPTKLTLGDITGRYVGEFIKSKTGVGGRFQSWRITRLIPEEKAVMVVPLAGNRKTRLAAAKEFRNV